MREREWRWCKVREKREGEQRRDERRRRRRRRTVCEMMELVISVSWGELRVESAAIMIVISSITGSCARTFT